MLDPLDSAECADKVTSRTWKDSVMKKPTLDQMKKAFREDEGDKAVSSDELQTVMTTGLLHDLWDAARKGTVISANRMQVRALLGLEPQTATATFNPNSFTLVVNYGAKLEDAARMGQYGYVNPNFTSANFPTELTGTVTLEGGRLVHFGRDMSTEAVERKLEEMGLRPGNAHELAAFGAAFPEEQRKYPIVALGGKRWRNPDGGECVACLDRWRGERELHLGVVADGWRGLCRFLAFPK